MSTKRERALRLVLAQDPKLVEQILQAHAAPEELSDRAISLLVGKGIRERRTKLKWTQDVLADAIGMNRTSVVNIETGKQAVTLGTLYRVAHALGLDPWDLLPTMSEVTGKRNGVH